MAMNRGALALRRVIREKTLSQGQVRRECGMPTGYVSRLLTGERIPGRKHAQAMLRAYGIDPSLWDEEVEDEEPDVAALGCG